jgi:peptidyl-dipeptidase Dcp
MVASEVKAMAQGDNPLLEAWQGPYGGVPAFDQVRVEHFRPAVDAAMAEARRQYQAISDDPAPPTFANTLGPFEDAGRTLNRVMTYYGVWESTLSTPDVQELERELSPKLAAFADEIVQNEKLFRRIEAVQQSAEAKQLPAEAARLLWRTHLDFVLAGARLGADDKRRLTELNQRLSSLYTDFGQNVLADEEERFVLLGSEAELEGLPAAFRAALAAAATEHGKPGQWLVANTRSAVEPFLAFAAKRELREKVWREFVSRGDHGDAHDNNALITEILKLRAERAKLLGFATHAHLQLADSMAKTPEAALGLMETVWKPAVARVHEEVADMRAIAVKDGLSGAFEPWDYRYYAEKVRKAKYDLDLSELEPYLQLDRLREAMFWVAGELFGLEFVPTEGLPVYHPDVRVFEVRRRADQAHVGLWYFDPYARAGKRSGAWMSSYRDQERFAGEQSAIVSNNANFIEPAAGEPLLVGWDDAVTLFHEFGHALHGLLSNVRYPSLSGTSVPRDYVEFPSQVLERWLLTPELLSRFALHVRSGEPMPRALIEKVERARYFNQGFDTVEYLSTALIDMKAHLAGATPVEPKSFERDTLTALGMPSEIVMRHRMPHLSHVFSGDGYSAGYYAYLWADMLAADAYEAFTEAGGPYDHEVATKLLQHVLSVGNSVDPEAAYLQFRGKPPNSAALMRRRGFPVPEK